MLSAFMLAAYAQVTQVVYFATSKDGLRWSVVSNPIALEADTPDALRLHTTSAAGRANDLLLYYTDRLRGGLFLIRSFNNGRTWSDPIQVSLGGSEIPLLSPSAVQLSGGDIRLYAQKKERDSVTIIAARAADGVDFQLEAECYSGKAISDPEVVNLGAKWLMFLSTPTQTLLLESQDGLSFSATEKAIYNRDSSVGAVLLPDGRIRVFTCGLRGMWSLISKDGITFSNEYGYRLESIASTVILHPSPFTLSDGRHALVCVVAWKAIQPIEPIAASHPLASIPMGPQLFL